METKAPNKLQQAKHHYVARISLRYATVGPCARRYKAPQECRLSNQSGQLHFSLAK